MMILTAFILYLCAFQTSCSSIGKTIEDIVVDVENSEFLKNLKNSNKSSDDNGLGGQLYNKMFEKFFNFLNETTATSNDGNSSSTSRSKRQYPMAAPPPGPFGGGRGGAGLRGGPFPDGGLGIDYPDFYDFYPNDFLYDYYDWVCSDLSCQLCNILTSECCDPDVTVNCFLPDSCLNNPCLSGGTCVPSRTLDNREDFICICLPGFTGKYCQLVNEFFFPPPPPPPPPPMPPMKPQYGGNGNYYQPPPPQQQYGYQQQQQQAPGPAPLPLLPGNGPLFPFPSSSLGQGAFQPRLSLPSPPASPLLGPQPSPLILNRVSNNRPSNLPIPSRRP